MILPIFIADVIVAKAKVTAIFLATSLAVGLSSLGCKKYVAALSAPANDAPATPFLIISGINLCCNFVLNKIFSAKSSTVELVAPPTAPPTTPIAVSFAIAFFPSVVASVPCCSPKTMPFFIAP